MSVHVFRLKTRERLFTGIASGFVLFILFSNLLAMFLPLSVAYWGAAWLLFALGLLFSWRSSFRPRFPLEDWLVWQQMLVFLAFLALFVLINRGLAIFDDYANLPIVSIIATGDVPPHFHLNPEKVLDYHYGMHLFAASLMRIGGLFPWSALDLSKALTIALSINLSWLWYRRYTRVSSALLLAGLIIFFGGGARWLLLFLPDTILQEIGGKLQLVGSAVPTGPDFYSALIRPWKIEGGGPFPFPFAFVSGMTRPLSMALGSNSAFPNLALFLFLLLARRKWQPSSGLVYGLMIACLALTADQLFVICWGGILLVAILRAWSGHSISKTLDWGWTLLPGAILAPLMGGVLAQLVRRSLAYLVGGTSTSGIGLPSIAIRWPPAFFSGHLGALALSDPWQILIALAEMGPILLLAPWVTRNVRKYLRSGKLFMAGISLMAIVSFLLPIFIRFVERERDISRMTGTALSIWMVLGIPYVWQAMQKSRMPVKILVSVLCAVTILNGIALFPSELIAIARPQLSYFVHEPDAQMSKSYWDKLDSHAWVLDPSFPYRPAVLFGRTTGAAFESLYIPLPGFIAMVNNPDPVQFANAGYDFVYLDKETWLSLTPEQRRTFQQPCVQQVAEQRTELNDFRRLLDIHSCQD